MLGNGAYLYVDLSGALTPGDRDSDPALALEHSARALRACARRWGADRVPAVALGGSSSPDPDRVETRIAAFLQALVNVQNAVNVVVARRGRVVASAVKLAEEHLASIPFTHRRLAVEAEKKSDSSHAELVGDDYYAVSFWYDACLVAFFSAPYAVDFVRHRARLVTRELSHLLPLLDEPPPSGTSVAPIPE